MPAGGRQMGAGMEKNIEKRTVKEDWKLFARGVKLGWQICPQIMTYNIVCSVAQKLFPYFSLFMSSQLVNELAGECAPRRLMTLALITVAGMFVINIANSVLWGRQSVWDFDFYRRFELYNAEQQYKMQYEHLEDPKVTALREDITLAIQHGQGLPVIVGQSLPSMISSLSNLIVSAALTFSMFRTVRDASLTGFLAFINSPASAVLMTAIIFLNVMLSVRIAGVHTDKLLKAWEPQVHHQKFLNAYGSAWGSDVTIFNLRKIILKQSRKALIRPPHLAEVEKVRVKYSTFSMLQNAVLRTAVFVITAAKAFIGTFEIGSFLLYKGTVTQFVGSFIRITDDITKLRQNNKYLERWYQFLDLPDEMYHGTLAVEKRDDIDYEIEFRNVSFRYPGTDAWVLRNVSMRFHIGDKLAIVGENGSGKTTFIKLLCRLYDPTEGVILLNGIDIAKYRYQEYLALFSVVFQDYRLFDFSLAANITADFDYDRDRVQDCLEKAGFGERFRNLEQGVEAVIGRRYENQGIDLSGGEEQKVALARALYKDAPFVVLDEPTAALDPIAEAAVYESFHCIVRNKTTVVISHRLSSCKFCDDIIVFDRGELVQRGSHDVLVSGEGKYSELWNAQAQYYQNN